MTLELQSVRDALGARVTITLNQHSAICKIYLIYIVEQLLSCCKSNLRHIEQMRVIGDSTTNTHKHIDTTLRKHLSNKLIEFIIRE